MTKQNPYQKITTLHHDMQVQETHRTQSPGGEVDLPYLCPTAEPSEGTSNTHVRWY